MMHDTSFFGWMSGWMWLITLIILVPVWRICTRMGFPGWISLLTVIPLLNLGLLYFLAFSSWPRDKTEAEQEDS